MAGYALKPGDLKIPYGKLKLQVLAKRIARHIRALEADEEWNQVPGKVDSIDGKPRPYLWNAGAHASGNKVFITSISYQGSQGYTKADALAYLEWLDSGNKGTIFHFRRSL